MGIAGFARTGLAGEDGDQGAGGRIAGLIAGGAGGQALDRGLDSREVVEGVEPVGAGAQLARSLRTAEHEKAEDSGLIAPEIEDGADPVLILGNTRVADWSDQGKIFEGMESLANLFFAKVEDRVTTGALVACVQQRVEREGVVLWRGDLFFDQGAKNAELGGIKLHRY
jgi:hypothetical protein